MDGYTTLNGKKTVLEALGCFYHGHPECYSSDTVNPVCNQKMSSLYQETLQRFRFIEAMGYSVQYKWECEFNREKANNPETEQYLNEKNFVSPLQPRECFYGGRCNASRLYYKVSGDEEIRYVDFCSLYPSVNKYCKYPTGHPRIFTNVDSSCIDQYERLIKCKVLPPRALFHPVLPVKIHDKLMFPLCRSCIESKEQNECNHNNEERAIIGSWVTDEVKIACNKGYEILEVYEIWHFDTFAKYDHDSRSGGLFTDYINTFLKLKQQA